MNADTPRGYLNGGIGMSNEKACPHCCERKKKRTPEEQKDLLKRLKLAEGQIRGIQNMVENDAYCPDILIQVSAVTAALNSFNKRLLACHIRTCVSEDIRSGDEEAIDEFVGMLQKLMK
jgi:DNA-binding FrmR family transcriptional regulator